MAEPAGLGLSLDDLIANQGAKQRQERGYGKQQRSSYVERRGDRDRDRGAHYGERRFGGGGGDRGGPRYEQRPHQRQQQQQHRQQHQGGGGSGGRDGGRGGGRDGGRGSGGGQRSTYRKQQACWEEAGSGDVVFTFMGTELVRVDAAGEPASCPAAAAPSPAPCRPACGACLDPVPLALCVCVAVAGWGC